MNDLVVSYQMGKVASSSIAASVDSCEQFHSWSSEEPIMFFSSRNTGSAKGRLVQYFKWKLKFYKLKRRVQKAIGGGGRIKLVVGVREPVSRNASGYFQSLMSREINTTVEQAIEKFYAFCPHMGPLHWFDIELKEKLDIDVYEYPFDLVKGCGQFKKGVFDVFIYRQEDLRANAKALGEFLNITDFKLLNVNDGGDKWSAELYRKFLKEFNPSPAYLDLMYESKYFEHFYGEKLKGEYKAKWDGDKGSD